MTTEVITLSSVCSGGNHLTFSLTGAKALSVLLERSDIEEPISDDEARAFCKIIGKMARAGRTLAQARTLLEAGVTVTV